jgi:hypothetical protein
LSFDGHEGSPRGIIALWRPAAQTRHFGAGGRLVDEDQPRWIEIELPLEPGLAGGLHVVALLFGCMRFLLNVMRRRSKKRHSVPMPTLTSRALSFSCSSTSVMSGVSAAAPSRNAASASMRPDLRSPPCFHGATSPCLITRLRQRMALDALTPNRIAA